MAENNYTAYTATNGPTVLFQVSEDGKSITFSLDSLKSARDFFYEKAFHEGLKLYPLGKAHLLDTLIKFAKRKG